MSTALITGASRGFGRAVAVELAVAGWDLVIGARTESDLATAKAEMEQAGASSVIAIAGDITDPDHVARLVAATSGRSFRLLVNNASMLGPSPQPRLIDYPIATLESVIAVNLAAPLRLVQAVLPELRQNQGTIVNVTSDAGVEPYEGWGGYGSSKAALEQMSKVLAVEEPEVRVYWFDPGDMRTRMHQEAFPGEDISDRPLPETRAPALRALIEDAPPSGRYTAEQILAGALT